METQKIRIQRVPVEQKSVLRQLLEFCSYDFSIYDQADVNELGYFGYKWLDRYWSEEGRIPYFIRAVGKLAGFVLVGHYRPKDAIDKIWSVNEFFIMQKYRRQGIGRYVASYIFDKFRGSWEVNQIYSNDISRFFWEQVISEYTGCKYTKNRAFKDGFERQFIFFDNS